MFPLYSILLNKINPDGSLTEIGKISEWCKDKDPLKGSSTQIKLYTKEEAEKKKESLSEWGYKVEIILEEIS